jgi:hypothetical protein
MHGAPSVSFPVGRSAFVGMGLCVMGTAGLALQVFWWVDDGLGKGAVSSAQLGRWMSVGLAWMGTLAWALRMWWCTPKGELRWYQDSTHEPGVWTWRSAAYPQGLVPSSVTLIWTLGQGGLMYLGHPLGANFWVWVDSGDDPARWRALRCALHAHARH